MKNYKRIKKLQTFIFCFSLLTFIYADSSILMSSECLTIASPYDFYYNSVILSWTPIAGADHYILEYMIGTSTDTVKLPNNWLQITALDRFQWEVFVSAGVINYRVTAIDSAENVIEGPTDWAEFRCYLYNFQDTQRSETIEDVDRSVDPECLSVCNPPSFLYNTIILSWTPITGADHYKINFRVLKSSISIETHNWWFKMTADNPFHWEFLVKLTSIAFNIEAYDNNGILIAGPTEWSLFIKN